jgi:hypothetical protein
MGLFDTYRPAAEQRCPVCQTPLHMWQGKDGPCGLFVWAENMPAPVDQEAGEECNLEPHDRERVRLPSRFIIYSYDCPEHSPIEAECRAPEGAWTDTIVLPYLARHQDRVDRLRVRALRDVHQSGHAAESRAAQGEGAGKNTGATGRAKKPDPQ